MSHVRTQLRQAVRSVLEGAATLAGRVSVNRQIPEPRDDLLRLTVRTPLEVVQRAAMGGHQDRRIRLQVQITGRDGDEEVLADRLDVAAAEIETLMTTSETFGGLAMDTEYLGSELRFDAATDRFSGGLTLSYDTTVTTMADDPHSAV